MEAIYLYLRAQVAVGTFYMKYPVGYWNWFAEINDSPPLDSVYT